MANVNKITEIIVEPDKVYVGSTFKLKIKAIRYMTYAEIETKTYEEIEKYAYNELEGE